MGKMLFASFLCLVPIHVNAADIECLGFLPAVVVTCVEDGLESRVEGFEEKRCGEGRDGVLNDAVAIFSVDGPTWYGADATAEVSFVRSDGEPVTLAGCTVED